MPFTATVCMLRVTLTPLDCAATGIAGDTLGAALQVLPSRVLAADVGVIIILLFVPAAVVLMTQVPADAATSQYTVPEAADPQETTEGLAAVPTAEQSVAVA